MSSTSAGGGQLPAGAGRPPTPGAGRPPILNTHVHLPPNFSAFDTAEDAVDAAAAEGVRVMGASNFHDRRIYARFAAAAATAGIVPLFGLEIISVVGDLRDAGTKVNDPANPGRMYVCGKGIDPFAEPTPAATRLIARARGADVDRMRAMVPLVATRFAEAGIETAVTAEAIVDDVAARAGVPGDWVVLQERHVATAFQEALFRAAPPGHRGNLLARVLGGPGGGDADDPVAVQGEIRARLMKAGRPAFVPESPVSFDDAYRLVLEMGGIPCYPTLADGVSPVCGWEAPPAALAERVLARGMHAAELVPNRNATEVVDAYVAALRGAGVVVMAGTEHNTRERIPLEPRCVDGSRPSPAARAAFREATCVVAAHQHLRATGHRGYVDGEGRLDPGFPDGESRIRWYAELGEELIRVGAPLVAGFGPARGPAPEAASQRLAPNGAAWGSVAACPEPLSPPAAGESAPVVTAAPPEVDR